MPSGRDLLVRIRADVTDFQNKLRLAQGQVKNFDNDLQKGTSKSGKLLGALGLSYAGVGVAAGAAVASMVKSSADFEQGLANVNATGAVTKAQLAELRDLALEFGQNSSYSATEATAGMEGLLKAGVEAKDLLSGGLKGALDLAAAGQMDVGAASEAAAGAMAQFNLKGKDVPHVADVLAAGAGKAQGNVSDLAMGLAQVGGVAAEFDQTLEGTVGMLAAMAEQGYIGSDAATSVKTSLLRLVKPADEAQALLTKYNIATRDGKGNMLQFSQIAGNLRSGLSGLSADQRDAALATIFGTDAIRAASVMYKNGEKGIGDWTQKVNDSGYAAETAQKKTDTLWGDLDKLKNSWDSFASGTGGGEGLRPLVQGLDAFVDSLAAADKAIADMKKRNAAGKGSFWDQVWGDVLGGGPGGKPFNPKDLFQADRLGRPETFGGKKTLDVPFRVRLQIAQGGRSPDELAKIAMGAGIKPRDMKIALKIVGTGAKEIAAVEAAMKRASRIQMLGKLGYKGKELKDALRDLEAIDREANKPKEVPIEPAPGSKGKLQKLIDEAVGRKPKKKVPVDADDKPARRTTQSFVNWANGQKASVYIGVTGPGASQIGKRAGGIVGYASGGRVPGVGPSDGSDNVLARTQHGTPYAIRSGEWIINERASRLNDRYLRAINSGLDLNKILPGFAGGGRVPGSSGSPNAPVVARLVDNRVAMGGDGIIRLVDDRVQVWMGDSAHQAKQAANRRGAR